MSVASERRRLRQNLAQPGDALPASTLRDATPWLRAPFTPEAVRFKVQEAWTDDAGKYALIVPYIGSRLVVERLNLVCPDLWSEEFEQMGGHLWCSITIRGDRHGDRTVTRQDIGDTYNGKGLVSDARKRAAVQFGVGVSLYAVPKVQLESDDRAAGGAVLLRPWREDGKPWLKLTLIGERHCRDLYRRWLLNTGIKAFGTPIDHGDVADCPDMMQTTEPPSAREPKATPSRSRARRAQPAEPSGAPEELSPEAELMALLAITEDGLHAERFACDRAMAAMGMDGAKRLAELRGAKDRRGLEALLVRLSNVPPKTDDAPIESEDGST